MRNAFAIAIVLAAGACIGYVATIAMTRHTYMTACQSSGWITADECAQLWRIENT